MAGASQLNGVVSPMLKSMFLIDGVGIVVAVSLAGVADVLNCHIDDLRVTCRSSEGEGLGPDRVLAWSPHQ